MDLVYKYYSNESKYAIENLEKGYISFSSLETMNDPTEGLSHFVYQVETNIEELKKKLGEWTSYAKQDVLNIKWRVFCATKEYDNPLMWAHYANSHKGFCVGYAKEEIQNLYRTVKGFCIGHTKEKIQKLYRTSDVVYEEKPLQISELDEATLEGSLFRKSNIWKYEKEYRAICMTDELAPYILKRCKPAKIYFGIHTPEETRCRLFRIAIEYNIPICQMVQDPASYTLNSEEWMGCPLVLLRDCEDMYF